MPSVIEPVIFFALGASPCQVLSIKAKLLFTEVCDVIVSVWSGALLLDLRLKTKFCSDGLSNRSGSNWMHHCLFGFHVLFGYHWKSSSADRARCCPLHPNQAQFLGPK
jgi:hypothetical protein